MATITTPVYLEDAARTAGEAWTINGGTLTIRTDSRWHANAPASMTGSLAAVTISSSLGGQYKIDGTTVRWMPFDSGTGNVPVIGQTITQGAVSGYLLGVWASITSVPTAVGAAMPTSGFIKFREVTGGTFTAGALSGIGANATSADVVGWIEVVHDQGIAITVPRLGKFETRGNWFYLDDTTGSAGQILQVPTNGGGALTEAPGVWIEDSPGAGTYDFYPALKTTTSFTTGDLSTDERCKFVQNMGGGQIRIGSDGTNNIGYVPVSGCKTRIPNIFLRQCATGTRTANAAPHTTIATRPDFTTTNAGVIDIEFTYGDWYFRFSQPFSVKLKNTATFDAINISECASPLDLDNGFTGMSGNLDVPSLSLTSNFAGGTIKDWGGPRGNAAGTNDHDISLQYCIGQTFLRVRAGILKYARSSGQPWYINQCSNITLDSCRASNGGVLVNTSFNTVIKNHDHVDRYRLGTIATTPYYAIQFTKSCVGAMVDGMTFGLGGLIANCHPYNGLVSAAASSDIDIRNFGTRSAFLNGGSSNQPGYIFGDLGNNLNIRVQRCYLVPTRTGAHLTVNSSKNMLFEDVYGDFADAIVSAGLNMLVRGGGGTNSTTGQASVYGTHWGGAFTSDTVGRIWLALNEPTLETAQYTEASFSPGSGFTSAGGLSLATQGDYYICEMQIFKKQHTGFDNSAPTLTGTNTGNYSYEYQIDTGSGWNGSWKTLNGPTLSSESISPSAGFKLKLKITCTTADPANLISYVRILTTSTLQAQIDNLYPLDTSTITLTGLQEGSEVRCYLGTNPATAVHIDGTESSGTTFVLTHAYSGETGYIQIFSLGYQPIRLDISYLSEDFTIPIQQVVDRVYYNA